MDKMVDAFINSLSMTEYLYYFYKIKLNGSKPYWGATYQG
jgi:hypothetical protein